MRDYGIIKPAFWLGKTGRALRGNMEAQVVAMYLLTGPHANMIGLYRCPVAYISADTGLTMEGASKGLQYLIESGFCIYDEESEIVFVTNMIRFQVGEDLKPTDNRIKNIISLYNEVSDSTAKQEFSMVYWKLLKIEKPSMPEGASKGLRRGSLSQRSENRDQRTELTSKDSCAELKNSTPPPEEKTVIVLPLTAKDGEYKVPESDFKKYIECYPALDVMQELRQMLAWLDANPTNRKTRTGIKAFITRWLSKSQNRAPAQHNGGSGGYRPPDIDWDDTSWADGLVIEIPTGGQHQ